MIIFRAWWHAFGWGGGFFRSMIKGALAALQVLLVAAGVLWTINQVWPPQEQDGGGQDTTETRFGAEH